MCDAAIRATGYPRYQRWPARGTNYERVPPAGAKPRRDGRATGTPLPHRAVLRPERRARIRDPLRGLHHADAPVRGVHPGPPEDARVPRSLPQPTVYSAAPGVSEGWTV